MNGPVRLPGTGRLLSMKYRQPDRFSNSLTGAENGGTPLQFLIFRPLGISPNSAPDLQKFLANSKVMYYNV
jgi:hypothetical protein